MGIQGKNSLRMDGTVFCCIQVQGILDANWSSRLGGLEMTIRNTDSEQPVTALCGTLIDQAALMGVLNTLYNLRLPLLVVECKWTDAQPQAM